ncbi:hypothetical protein UFOVP51_12 [uncultured Caudovirales phage]|uniref:Uncharacterized protein n=1 Tax=uncultured Caudovirales phage TaxID=2100421 RepID=A0A6J5KT87_9CAUD|nr:hypothetical protein UFOVP51_12 [uncultured Caudovirales phage]CAB4240737.1 hypothetical protein UFOVP34_8 [uncultured Caudovirales phage]
MTPDELDKYTYKESERLFKYICKQPNMVRQIADYMEKDSDYLGYSTSFDAIKFLFYSRPSVPSLLDLVSKATNMPILMQNGNIKLLTLDGEVGIKFTREQLLKQMTKIKDRRPG